MEWIASALRKNRGLKSLILNFNGIETKGFQMLADALLENESLRTLSIAEDGVDQEGQRILNRQQTRVSPRLPFSLLQNYQNIDLCWEK